MADRVRDDAHGRSGLAGARVAFPGPAEAGQARDERHREHPPARGQPEAHRHEHRHAAERYVGAGGKGAFAGGPDGGTEKLRVWEVDTVVRVTGLVITGEEYALELGPVELLVTEECDHACAYE